MIPTFVWAPPGTTFPAGSNPWNGQPVSLAPPGNYWSPQLPLAAEEVNYNFSQVATDLALLARDLPSPMAWYPEFAQNGSNSDLACAWAPRSNRWLLLEYNNSTTVSLLTSLGLDQAAQWASIGTIATMSAAPAYGAVCEDPGTAGQYWIATVDTTASHNKIEVSYFNGSAWSPIFGQTAVGNYGSIELATLGAYLVFAAAGGGSGDSLIGCTNNQGATVPIFLIPTTGQSTVYLKSNGLPLDSGGQLVCIVGQNSAGTYPVFTSPDGITWGTSNSLTALVGSGYGQVVGLTWTQDATSVAAGAAGCWIAIFNPTVSGIPTCYRSADGITWTAEVTGGMSTQNKVADVAAIGPNVVATLADGASSPYPSGQIVSTDGGVTWGYGRGGFSGNTSGGAANRARVVASPNGWLAVNGVWVRYSVPSGTPPAI